MEAKRKATTPSLQVVKKPQGNLSGKKRAREEPAKPAPKQQNAQKKQNTGTTQLQVSSKKGKEKEQPKINDDELTADALEPDLDGASEEKKKKRRKKTNTNLKRKEFQLKGTKKQAKFFKQLYLACKPTALGIAPMQQTDYAEQLQPSHFKTRPAESSLRDIDKSNPNTPRSDGSLVAFLKEVCTPWETIFKERPTRRDPRGSPYCLIVTSSALRACEIIRQLAEFKDMAPIGKLFAKHLKLEEQQAFLRGTVTRVCVGTPHRIMQLCTSNSLKLNSCKYVVIDMWRNQKSLNILEMNDTKADLFKLVFEHLFGSIYRDTMKIVLF